MVYKATYNSGGIGLQYADIQTRDKLTNKSVSELSELNDTSQTIDQQWGIQNAWFFFCCFGNL